MIAVDLSKQQAPDADPKQFSKLVLQQAQIEQEEQDSISFLKKQKKLFLNIHKDL